jgi:hypothetical protein
MKIIVFCDVIPRSLLDFTSISDERASCIFKVESKPDGGKNWCGYRERDS